MKNMVDFRFQKCGGGCFIHVSLVPLAEALDRTGLAGLASICWIGRMRGTVRIGFRNENSALRFIAAARPKSMTLDEYSNVYFPAKSLEQTVHNLNAMP